METLLLTHRASPALNRARHQERTKELSAWSYAYKSSYLELRVEVLVNMLNNYV
jgi:hypothetical protein